MRLLDDFLPVHLEIMRERLNHIIRMAPYMVIVKPLGADDNIIDIVTQLVANQLFRAYLVAKNLEYDIDGIENNRRFSSVVNFRIRLKL